jgi:hypothetical protein
MRTTALCAAAAAALLTATCVAAATGDRLTRSPLVLDGSLVVPGIAERLLLVRAATSRSGVVDAVYRRCGGRLERIHVEGMPQDGLVTAIVGRVYADIDCGPRPRTISQLGLEPVGRRWRVQRFDLELVGGRFVLTTARRSVQSVVVRRCAIDRSPEAPAR